MPNSSAVCCDANVVINWATQTGASPARAALESWITERRTLIAPLLLRFEVTNVLYRRERASLIPAGASRDGLNAILALNIAFISDVELHFKALELAQRFKLAAAYDAHYLALADRERCELWTGDKRLFNSVEHQFPLIRFIGSEHPQR